MIEIPMTEDEFDRKAATLREKHGIDLHGDAGTISKMGVTARYRYAAGVLAVEILEKPFFVSTEDCEGQMREFLGA